MSKTLGILFLAGSMLSACRAQGELKTVQTQQAGDITVTVLSESGSIKNGANDFVLEFRKANQLVDVGTVDVAPVMEMAGMAPMMGTANVTASDTPGRYRVTGGLTMAGLWKFNVKYGNGQSVRINVNAQ